MLVRRQSSVVKSMCQTSVVLNSRGRVGTHACTLLRGDGRCSGVLVAHKFQRKSLRACPFGASLRVKGQSLRAIPSREGTIPSPEGTSLRVKGQSLRRPLGVMEVIPSRQGHSASLRRPFGVPSPPHRHPLHRHRRHRIAAASLAAALAAASRRPVRGMRIKCSRSGHSTCTYSAPAWARGSVTLGNPTTRRGTAASMHTLLHRASLVCSVCSGVLGCARVRLVC